MDIASALLLKNNLTRKSSTPLSITGGRNERKRNETKSTVKFITYTLLADDICSGCTIKPTTLYYYGYNYRECFFMLINLLLKVVFLIVLNLHNKHAMKHFLLKCFFAVVLFSYKDFIKLQCCIRALPKQEQKLKRKVNVK